MAAAGIKYLTCDLYTRAGCWLNKPTVLHVQLQIVQRESQLLLLLLLLQQQMPDSHSARTMIFDIERFQWRFINNKALF